MKKILVTGGAGFVGSNLVAKLSNDKEYEVTVVDDFSNGNPQNLVGCRYELIKTDISNPNSELYKSDLSFDTIVHLAARGSVPKSIENPILTSQVNINGTQNLLEFARKLNSHFIFASSSSVYGSNLKSPKDEKDWVRPLSPYGASKLAGEALLHSYSSSFGLPSLGLRFFNVYGPKQMPNSDYSAVIPKWIWHSLLKQPVTLFGGGNISRDFTFVDTIVEVICTAIRETTTSAGIVNLAFGESISLQRVLEELRNYFPLIEVIEKPNRQGDIHESKNNPFLVHDLFPDIVPVQFSAGIEATVNWCKNLYFEIYGETKQ